MSDISIIDPARTYTLEDFVSSKTSDDLTYYNFSILELINGVEHLDKNLVEEYIDILISNCVTLELSNEEFARYKYAPDLLAYEVYGSVQLDFVILLINDMIDPKDFCKKIIKLPMASVLGAFLDGVYSKESGYIQQNRLDQNISM